MIIIGTKFNLLRHNFRLPLLLLRRNNPLRLRQSVSPLKTNNMIMLIEHCRANNIPKDFFNGLLLTQDTTLQSKITITLSQVLARS